MKSLEGERRPEGQLRVTPAPSQVLELLERLAGGERLVDAPVAMGLSQDQARAMFFVAAEIVRKSLKEPPSKKRRWLPVWRTPSNP